MKYSTLYTLHNKFMQSLKGYAIEYDCVSDSYHIAKNLLTELLNKSHKDEQLRNEYAYYIKHGSTIRLKTLLNDYTNWNFNSLSHYGAMDMIDSTHLWSSQYHG